MLKSIISILMKKKQNLLNNIQTKKSGKETINNNEKEKNIENMYENIQN